METLIVYFDDTQHALHQLAPMRAKEAQAPTPTHWVLVACPPRLGRHASRWVTRSARDQWRADWARRAFDQVAPTLRAAGHQVTRVLGQGDLPSLTRDLLRSHGPARVLDARRPRVGRDLQPVTHDQPRATEARWQVPGAVIGMGAALVLAAE